MVKRIAVVDDCQPNKMLRFFFSTKQNKKEKQALIYAVILGAARQKEAHSEARTAGFIVSMFSNLNSMSQLTPPAPN
tara:strand:+ start:241 stop:471 length:231 start_codon:yes stop_codon:yes gene_type:complete